MNRELRERAVLPVAIPFAAIIVTEVVVFSMSRVLLATGGTTAVVIALGAALAILLGAAMIAARPRIRTQAILGLIGVGLVGSIAAGAFAMQQKPFYERQAEANRPQLEVSAANLAFDTETLELSPAGAIIEFANEDTQPHNIAIYAGEDATGEALFKGDIIDPGASATYEVPKIEVGEHYFQCDVHPNMNGKAVVEEGAGEEAEPADEA